MNKKLIIGIVGIFAVSLGLMYVGSSYASYLLNKKQARANEVTFGCFSVTTEAEVNPITNSDYHINMTNTYPMSDAKGIEQEPYVFTITNTCQNNAYNTVTNLYLDIFKTNTLPSNRMRIAMQVNDGAISEAKYVTDFDEQAMDDTEIDYSYALKKMKVKYGSPVTIKLWLWLEKSAGNEYQNKRFDSKIRTVTDVYFGEDAEDIQTTQGKSIQEALDELNSLLS